MVSGMPAFVLSKWYLDCVTGAGDTSIAYTGIVNWGPVRLRYASLLESTAGAVKTRQSLRTQRAPEIQDGSLRWRSAGLKIEGEWQSGSSPISETIFETSAGSIAWHCLMPRAQARISERLGRGYAERLGYGYAERLDMTIAPWKLPIRTLRWGRFATASDWIVWIDWLGDFTRRIVYWNGRSVPAVRLEDRQIQFQDGARLTMDRSLVLREGPLGATALSAIPGVRDTFPARLLKVNESKWRSRARLERLGAPTVEGWAIHEKVEWPK